MKTRKTHFLTLIALILGFLLLGMSEGFAVCIACHKDSGGKQHCFVVKGKCSALPSASSCRDLPAARGTTVVRDASGKAFLLQRGERTQIASDFLSNFLARLSSNNKKQDAKAMAAELDSFLSRDDGKVSDKLIKEIEREIGTAKSTEAAPRKSL